MSDLAESAREKLEETIPVEMEEHDNEFRNYMRDVILGANDGLVSVFALVLGVAGGGFNPANVFLAGLAATIAGAISMSLGEYLSTKSQEQVYDAEREMEKRHIKYHRDHEIEELYEFYEAKGFEGELLEQIVQKIAEDDEVMLREMMMTEFGIIDEVRRVPIFAMVIVGIAFLIGSLPAIIPFMFVDTTRTGVIISTISCVIGLFAVGGTKGYLVEVGILKSGAENMFLGLIAAIVTYFVGSAVGAGIV